MSLQNAEHNSKFVANGRKLSKQVENTVGKGEIARCEQFLLFPQIFQKTYTAVMQIPGLVWERVKPLSHDPDFYILIRSLFEKVRRA